MVEFEKADLGQDGMSQRSHGLTEIESDTIGEILNISMGAAATAVSTLLGRQVRITTPVVSTTQADGLQLENLEPSVGIEIKYIEGLTGSNYMVMKRKDINAIVSLLIGEDVVDEEGELDEIQLSAVSEIMNQMMGSSCTALASFFSKSINISTPEQFDSGKILEKMMEDQDVDQIVSVRFFLEVDQLLNSEFVTVMPISFTKELVANVMNLMDEPQESEEEPAAAPPAPPVQEAPPPPQMTWQEAPPQVTSPQPQAQPQMAPPQPQIQPQTVSPPPTQIQPQPTVSVQMMNYANFDDDEDGDAVEAIPDNFSLLLTVPLDVSVEIGRTSLPVKGILDLRQGSLIELDRQAGDPADILVNGQLIARGDVVVIDDNFGVRVTSILSNRDIAKKLT